ncbi:MAG: hypothetical protein H8D67_22535 [Deltaproteobacteria bacterium]|nr:hypothetical protein [Deltaproteobacteria bacterium]
MIHNEKELRLARIAIENLITILIQAKNTHSAEDYHVLSAPILIELQQRQDEVLAYLARTVELVPAVS